MQLINRHLTISGRVQGVGFRWSTQRLAQQAGLQGFVKNLADGRVYVEVQGEEAVVERFVQRLAAGPTPYAIVEKVDQTAGKLRDYPDFGVRF